MTAIYTAEKGVEASKCSGDGITSPTGANGFITKTPRLAMRQSVITSICSAN